MLWPTASVHPVAVRSRCHCYTFSRCVSRCPRVCGRTLTCPCISHMAHDCSCARRISDIRRRTGSCPSERLRTMTSEPLRPPTARPLPVPGACVEKTRVEQVNLLARHRGVRQRVAADRGRVTEFGHERIPMLKHGDVQRPTRSDPDRLPGTHRQRCNRYSTRKAGGSAHDHVRRDSMHAGSEPWTGLCCEKDLAVVTMDAPHSMKRAATTPNEHAQPYRNHAKYCTPFPTIPVFLTETGKAEIPTTAEARLLCRRCKLGVWRCMLLAAAGKPANAAHNTARNSITKCPSASDDGMDAYSCIKRLHSPCWRLSTLIRADMVFAGSTLEPWWKRSIALLPHRHSDAQAPGNAEPTARNVGIAARGARNAGGTASRRLHVAATPRAAGNTRYSCWGSPATMPVIAHG